METGLGGLVDATNVIAPERLLLAVITPLGESEVSVVAGGGST